MYIYMCVCIYIYIHTHILGSMLTNDGRCTCEIKSRIAMAKAAFPVVIMVWIVSRFRLKVETSSTRSQTSINSD